MSSDGLTPEEQATNYQTTRHIRTVQRLLHIFVKHLLDRADAHDQSKLERPEVELFTKYTPLLANTTYGSPEYEACRKALGPALAHHYARNSHHPEHHKRGVDDMTLIDVFEMLADWKAASLRHHDGNINKSIEKNADRFNLSPQLVRIFENTVAIFDDVKEQ